MKHLICIVIAMFISGIGYAINLDPERGYRGFVESENYIFPNIGFLSGDGGSSDFWTGISTTHGYQFNRHLFVGGGLSAVWMLNDEDYSNKKSKLNYLPIFAEIRSDWRFNRFTPFVDLRIGYNLMKHGAFSGALTVGHRFSWGRRVAINLALGVNLRGYRSEQFISGWRPDEGLWSQPTGDYDTRYDAKPVLRLGIEF